MALQITFLPAVHVHSKWAVARKYKFRAEYVALQCQSLIKPDLFSDSVISTSQNNLLRLDKIGLHINDYIKYKAREGQGESECAILIFLCFKCVREAWRQ